MEMELLLGIMVLHLVAVLGNVQIQRLRKFDFITPSGWISDWTSLLTEDGRCFSFWNEACWARPDY